MGALLWAAGAVLAQTLVLFPAITVVRARLRPRPVASGEVTPSVSVVVAAHDEAATIGTKLRTVLDADYPPGLLEVIVVSDGSTDDTPAAALAATMTPADDRLRVIELPRVGKAAALNAGVATATGEVVVFTDANSLFAPDALRQLVRPFADPEVGGVAGDQRYDQLDPAVAVGRRGVVGGERGYWNLDRLLKQAESASGNVIGATGALYAVRRALVLPVVDGVTDDFVTSTGVILQGHRLVFAPEAVVFEPAAPDGPAEYRRKVRVMTRGLRAVALRRQLLDPRRHGFYAYQLVNHKVLRRLTVLPLLVALASSTAAAPRSCIHRLALIAQLAVYVPGAVAVAHPTGTVGRSRLGGVAGYACLVQVAQLAALQNLLTGRQIDRWDPERHPAAQPAAKPTDELVPR